MSASFKRLKQDLPDGRPNWGLIVEGPVSAGDTVEVTKKDGSTTSVVVGKVLWSDHEENIHVCTIDRSEKDES